MQRQQIFIQYLRELEQYLPDQEYSEQDEVDYFHTLRTNPNLIWVDVYNETDLVGFVVIDSSPRYADWHIVETFIVPEYRRQHYMSNALQTFMATHPGTYSLYILNQNQVAKHFWATLFANVGYVLIEDVFNDSCGHNYIFAPTFSNNMS